MGDRIISLNFRHLLAGSAWGNQSLCRLHWHCAASAQALEPYEIITSASVPVHRQCYERTRRDDLQAAVGGTN